MKVKSVSDVFNPTLKHYLQLKTCRVEYLGIRTKGPKTAILEPVAFEQ